MHLIEFENYEVRPTEEFFTITPLRNLYKKYYETDWDKFMQLVSFIYHYADPRSSYAYIVDDKERFDEIVIQEGLPKGFKIDKELQECIEHYKQRIITASYNLLKSMRRLIDKVSKHLDEIDLDERDDKGKPIYTLSTIMQASKQVPQVVQELSNAEKAVIKEIEESGRIRGGYEKSLFDDGISM